MKYLLLALFLYLVAILYLYLFQERLIFRTDLTPKDVPIPPEAQLLYIDGLEVGLIDRDSDTTIFYFGGNANNALEALWLFKDLPYNIVTFNYPGYGRSHGEPSQEAILNAARKIFERFKARRNIVIGRSLGSGVAGYIAANYPVQGVILITPYHSLSHLAKLRYPFFPVNLLLRHPFPLYRWIEGVSAPVYVILAERDDTTPPKTIQKLLPHIKNLQKIVTIEGSEHANILQFEKTKKVIEEFIRSALGAGD